MDKEQKRFDWGILITVITCFIALVGINLSTFMAMNSKIDSFITEIHIETKDFHGRLCAIEERNRK